MLKKIIRSSMSKRRLSYTSDEIRKKSTLIKDKLFTHFDFDKVKIVHTFISINKNNEINTTLINTDIGINYPHIDRISPIVDFKNKTLQHRYYNDDTVLYKNKYDIKEPIYSMLFTDLEDIDLTLVPLLAFDKVGNRVGYGGGYYDKFLKGLPCKKIGLSLEEPIDLIEDVNDHDVKLDYCITPNNIYTFFKSNI